jgi:hypothetical protein
MMNIDEKLKIRIVPTDADLGLVTLAVTVYRGSDILLEETHRLETDGVELLTLVIDKLEGPLATELIPD